VLVVEGRTLSVPLGQELILARLGPQELAEGSRAALSFLLLEALEHGPQVRVQLATGRESAPATRVWLVSGVRR
jgi:hypothetical protein